MFTNAYTDKIYASEHVHTDTKLLRVILDAKYEKSNLHKFMETQCQHLTVTQRNELLKLLQNLKSCSMEHLLPVKISSRILILKGVRNKYDRNHIQ